MRRTCIQTDIDGHRSNVNTIFQMYLIDNACIHFDSTGLYIEAK